MIKKCLFGGSLVALAFSLFLLSFFAAPADMRAAEKLKIGTGVKFHPAYYLPILGAEEAGYWKRNNLEVEWLPFKGSSRMFKAMATGSLEIGLTSGASGLQAISRGVPVALVAGLYRTEFYFWVKTDSRLKKPQDLRGVKLGAGRLGATVYAYNLLVTKSLGLEKDIKIIAHGGIRAGIAMLKTGGIQVNTNPPEVMADLQARGEVRPLLKVHDYLPKEWVDEGVWVHTSLIKRNPDTVKKVVKGLFQGINFSLKNPSWSMKRMKEVNRYSDASARLIFKHVGRMFFKDGKVSLKAVENVRDFLIEYGIVAKEKFPPLKQVYLPEFTR